MSFLLARTIRSGVVEAEHHGWAVVTDASGSVLESFGPIDTPFLYRSAVKPFQARVSQEHGAALAREQLAVACSSHDAYPAHLALLGDMLASVGLSEGDLGCPPIEPNALGRRLELARRGEPRTRRMYHACSGKHTGFLRACIASGWPTESYLDPDHPLQRRVLDEIAAMTGVVPGEVAVDGCGAPAPSGTVAGLATAFARLTTDPRYAAELDAMTAYPALLSSNNRSDGRLGAWWTGPVKRGAEGVIATARRGIGIAVKSRDGSSRIAAIGLIAVMTRLGMLPDAALAALESVAQPRVLGGGRPVGSIVPALADR